MAQIETDISRLTFETKLIEGAFERLPQLGADPMLKSGQPLLRRWPKNVLTGSRIYGGCCLPPIMRPGVAGGRGEAGKK